MSDTNGDGIDDRIDSWSVSMSHVLRDARGRRDGWVYRGSHYVTVMDPDTSTWGAAKKISTHGLHFLVTCKRQ